MKIKTITLVGLGLMGGSLAAACRKKIPKAKIIGVTRSAHALRIARKKKWIHEGTSELEQGIAQADLIILCTPVDTLPSLLKKIDSFAKPGTLVTDVGSVKKNIEREISKRNWKRIQFISAHPMVGSHEKGIQAVMPKLYDNGYTFLIKPKSSKSLGYRTIRSFWKKMSPKIYEVTVREHDRIVSEISHIPHVIATCLMHAVPSADLKFSSSGFRDTTRVAQGNPDIWVPVVQANRIEILRSLKAFGQSLKDFEKAARSGKTQNLKKIFEKAVKKRTQL